MYLIQESDNSEIINTITDILNTNSLTDEQRQKYIKMLKVKYDYDYQLPTDSNLIKTASLDKLYSVTDFSSYANYREYAREIFVLRNYHPSWKALPTKGEISIEHLESLMLVHHLSIDFTLRKSGASNNAEARGTTIIMDSIAPKHIVIHELGHVIDFLTHYSRKGGMLNDIVYAPSSYGTSNAGECFAEGFLHYTCDKNYAKEFPTLIPEWKKITAPYKALVQDILEA